MREVNRNKYPIIDLERIASFKVPDKNFVFYYENAAAQHLSIVLDISFENKYGSLCIMCNTCKEIDANGGVVNFFNISFNDLRKVTKEKGCFLFEHDCYDSEKFRIILKQIEFNVHIFIGFDKWHLLER